MKYIFVILWAILFFSFVELFNVPKNVYYFIFGITTLLGGAWLIFYFFERKKD